MAILERSEFPGPKANETVFLAANSARIEPKVKHGKLDLMANRSFGLELSR